MNIREYIESGTLELYVFGKLTEDENREVQQIAAEHSEVRDEILAIEKAVISLSYSVSPYLSAENYDKIRRQLIEKHEQEERVVPLKARSGAAAYIGWAAAIVLLMGLVFQYYRYQQAEQEVQQATAQRGKFEQMVAALKKKNTETEQALALVRGKDVAVIQLQGQQAAPQASAKVYFNKNTNEIYVDMAGLPEPPEGKVYQLWALKLTPLTPTSIGIVDDMKANNGIIKAQSYEGPEAFGITLEPAGGSASPTMEQLYTLGKV